MKKRPAVVLLILGAAAAIFGLSLANLILTLILMHGGVALAIIVTGGAVFGIDRLRVLFAKKYEFSAPKFFLCAYAPSVAASAVCYAVVRALDKSGYYKGFMAGLGEYLVGLAWLITSAAALAIGALILWLMSRRRGKTL